MKMLWIKFLATIQACHMLQFMAEGQQQQQQSQASLDKQRQQQQREILNEFQEKGDGQSEFQDAKPFKSSLFSDSASGAASDVEELLRLDRENDKFDSVLYPDKRLFVVELLKMIREEHGVKRLPTPTATNHGELESNYNNENIDTQESGSDKSNKVALNHRQSFGGQQSNGHSRQKIMNQLLAAINAEGDSRRLLDWSRTWLNSASLGELTTQFVVSKLGSVNCAALLKQDSPEKLIPRFLLFNDHYVDVPFELSLGAFTANECLSRARFDPQRKTVLLIHGYLSGYTLIDGLTNIKNRLLDLNNIINTRAKVTLNSLRRQRQRQARRQQHQHQPTLHPKTATASAKVYYNESQFDDRSSRYYEDGNEDLGDSDVKLEEEELLIRLRQQQYNVIIVDWFDGANPTPRSNYIRSAVNAPVVGQLIARFLLELVDKCGTQSSRIQIIAHSLGCHVAGFAGKAMNLSGKRLAKILHLDPIGLCFGRLFSKPQFRLSPDDALETQAVHVSLNIFDNPLDGTHSNFLVNGGRDQIGCGGVSELKNSTSSSISLLLDSEAKFNPCSHMRALALFEDDLSSEPGQCQIVGYKCSTYESFLAGKCGKCDSQNNQCRLMSLPPQQIPQPNGPSPELPAPLLGTQAAPSPERPSPSTEAPQEQTSASAATKTATTGTMNNPGQGGMPARAMPRRKILTQRIIVPVLNGQSNEQRLAEVASSFKQLQQQISSGNQHQAGLNSQALAQLGPIEDIVTILEEAQSDMASSNEEQSFVNAQIINKRLDDNTTRPESSGGQHKIVKLRLKSNNLPAWTFQKPVWPAANRTTTTNSTLATTEPPLGATVLVGTDANTNTSNVSAAPKRLQQDRRLVAYRTRRSSQITNPTAAASDGRIDEDLAITTEQVVANDNDEEDGQETSSAGSSSSGLRTERRLTEDQRERIVQTINKLRTDTRNALAESWSSIKNGEARYKVSTLIKPLQLPVFDGSVGLQLVQAGQQEDEASAGGGGYDSQEESQQQLSIGGTAPRDPLELEDIASDLLEPVPVPLGGQAIPEGSVMRPLYFVGTGPVSPYCVNYYQFRMLFPESRVKRFIEAAKPSTKQQQQQVTQTPNRNSLHLTIKLTDSRGHFFKGFTIADDIRTLTRVHKPESDGFKQGVGLFQLTMLLNTTRTEPVQIRHSVISYYSHRIFLADRIEVNYMSNISPEIRSKYSSSLCPVTINDEHRLVRYVECSEI